MTDDTLQTLTDVCNHAFTALKFHINDKPESRDWELVTMVSKISSIDDRVQVND